MEFLIENMTNEEMSSINGGCAKLSSSSSPECGIRSCKLFVCGLHFSACFAYCIGVGCHPLDCGTYSSCEFMPL